MTVDAAGSDQGNLFPLDAQLLEQFEGFFQHARHDEARVADVFRLRRTQVAACITRIFNDDGVRQAIFAHPFFQNQGNTARIRQDRNQRDVRIIRGQLRQVQRQAGANHDRIGAACTGLLHLGSVFGHRAHDVDGNNAIARGDFLRGADFAVQRHQVGAVDSFLVAALAGLFHQVRMVTPQIDAGDGAYRIFPRHGTGQPVRRNPDSHAALHDGKKVFIAKFKIR